MAEDTTHDNSRQLLWWILGSVGALAGIALSVFIARFEALDTRVIAVEVQQASHDQHLHQIEEIMKVWAVDRGRLALLEGQIQVLQERLKAQQHSGRE